MEQYRFTISQRRLIARLMNCGRILPSDIKDLSNTERQAISNMRVYLRNPVKYADDPRFRYAFGDFTSGSRAIYEAFNLATNEYWAVLHTNGIYETFATKADAEQNTEYLDAASYKIVHCEEFNLDDIGD